MSTLIVPYTVMLDRLDEMRRLMTVVERIDRLCEIEIGGEVDSSNLDDIRQGDYRPKQGDLFPDIPTLEPDLPAEFERMGRLDTYVIARRQDGRLDQPGGPEFTYYLFDRDRPIGYVAVIDPRAAFGGGYTVPNPPIGGTGLRVVSVYVDRTHAGQNLGVRLYDWLLHHVCDYLLPDDLQTPGGVAIWRRLLRSPKQFDVLVYDSDRGTIRRRKPGRDFSYVYQTNRLRPFVTMAGRAEELVGD